MSLETWRSLFRECLRGRGSQYCDDIIPLLVAVDQGIKPSLLWDVCTADTSDLLALLNQARSKGLLVSKLVLVELGLDVFIANVPAVTRALVSISGAPPNWLIDISAAEPKVASTEAHQEFSTHLTSIMTQLNMDEGDKDNPASTSSITPQQNDLESPPNENPSAPASLQKDIKALEVKLPDDVNLSTVFGCMLGYPHIYWWEGESGGNSLSGMPLKVFKFSATCSVCESVVELFSFSVPEVLEPELRPGIEHWGNVVNVRVEEAASYSAAKFKCDSVLCLSVAL